MKNKDIQELTMDEIWYECLAMWEDIVVEIQFWSDDTGLTTRAFHISIKKLKRQWLARHGYTGHISGNCFFCHVAMKDLQSCSCCPGVKVDPSFDCLCDEYNFEDKPLEFYKKLCELHQIYLDRQQYPLFHLDKQIR